MASIRTRALLAAGSTALALALAWAWRAARQPSGDPVRFTGDPAAVERLLLERRRESDPGPSGAAGGIFGTELVREPVSEADASKLFAMPSDLFVYDPFTYYRYKGGLEREVPLPEHAGGHFQKRTSAEGWSEDWDHLPEKRDLFVVVAGDSHTDGLCDNRESYANRLEAVLSERHPGMAIEVVNTGVSGYGFYNYLGVLEKLLPLKPQAFVVAFYGGNDFLDVVKPWHYFHHTAPPPYRADYWNKLDRVKSFSSAAVAMALNQLLYFQYNPDEVGRAQAGAAQACLEIVRSCAERGIRLFFVYIPPGIAVDGPQAPPIARAKEELGLSDWDLAQYDRLSDQLIGVLRERGVEVIDLRPELSGDRTRWYWADLHINVRAHQRIAELLLPRIEAACLSGR